MIITAGADLFRLNGQITEGVNMHTRLNAIYNGMKNRCYNPNRKEYKNYGGRGITICDEWNNRERVSENHASNTKGWIAFKQWALSNGYADNLTIDRINNEKGYSPENCRWVTIKEQNNNQRTNCLITYHGKTQNLVQWCEELGLKYRTVKSRLTQLHWTVDKAFTKSRNTDKGKND